MTAAMLAATLDGRVVVLDRQAARVILLEPRSEQIWRACTGRRPEEIAAIVGEAEAEITAALGELADAGLISSQGGRWSQVEVSWI